MQSFKQFVNGSRSKWVMLTRNCNVDDGLVNGGMGHVSHFVYGQNHAANTVVAIRVIFDNINVGKK